ncbi:MAG: hypothetical protein K5891_05780 [Lachnospiraceae bacterium]|nr:hypothetical protein [Lachnospiraceae bacterium]
MILNGFSKDYKLEWQDGPNGKPREIAVYVGPRYAVHETREEHRKRSILLIAGCALCMLFFVLGLYFDCAQAHAWFAVLPYACNFLTYMFFIGSIAAYLPVKESLTRREKTVGYDRFRPIGAIGAGLDLLSLAGSIFVLAKTETAKPADSFFLLCSLIQMGNLIYFYLLGRKIYGQIAEIRSESLNF